jgi:hypothetical protein
LRLLSMWIEEMRWDADRGWRCDTTPHNPAAGLVMYFGDRNALREAERYAELCAAYPAAHIIGCSATHTIAGDALGESGIVAVALGFARTPIRITRYQVTEIAGSRAAGEAIGKALAAPDLTGVFTFADGLRVDGSSFIAGLDAAIGPSPLIVGGMASDAHEYAEALVGADCAPQSGMTAAVGLYGDAIRFASGLASGWDAFGPRRRITRSEGNVLYSLDDKPPLDLYVRYLGDETFAGPSRRVIFPLMISPPEHPDRTLIRAPLAVDQGPAWMTFAGHMPEGWIARLMRGNADRLILGAGDAARQACLDEPQPGQEDRFALIVSCAGRYQLMGQRTVEEIEMVGAELGSRTKRIGFYSYGEIAPARHLGPSELHNQTMIVTSISEAGP